MPRVQYIHFGSAAADEDIARNEQLGYAVESKPAESRGFRTRLRQDPPAAVVISLERLPSHGREVGVWLRETKGTRRIPRVFVGGLPEKVSLTKSRLPDAQYADWKSLGRNALRHNSATADCGLRGRRNRPAW